MAKLLLFLLLAILDLLVPRSVVAYNLNYLLSGQTLDTNGQIKNGEFELVMQRDCNLVLHNGEWQSNTANKGWDCKLNLTDHGQLVINNGDGCTVWRSPAHSVKGDYAAVVHPEGRLVVFGPSVFKTVPPVPGLNSLRFRNIPVPGLNSLRFRNIPSTQNMLFSGQVLYSGEKLIAGYYQLIMQHNCNLVIHDNGWQSNTQGNGENCFLRLNHMGELKIIDDDFTTIWSSHSSSKQGDYVLILQDDGIGGIYGPAIWETSSKRAINDAHEKMIGMVTHKV